jgi:hypothetical protein
MVTTNLWCDCQAVIINLDSRDQRGVGLFSFGHSPPPPSLQLSSSSEDASDVNGGNVHTCEILQTSKASGRECLGVLAGSDELTCAVCRFVLAAYITTVEVFLMCQHYAVYLLIWSILKVLLT